ncbi:LysR family transcriptional regulator [Pseudonocardia humida]|uniref:LysR family transcriptional regulator n=1 Tax=Pseudonocardia humida TaxID=2800819 RepID=A0ABT1A814_9PSEU|nr:LysR family transcriptional regulator [Pseudonocardia humida]MCO1659170.1 LysR family transcriptional regulator [Pseudonocardia humida]
MDLDGVRTFLAVVDAGRFTDAADDLALTQQAVSKRIAALERDLGTRLFTRTARGARLTDDGCTFLPHARDLLRAAQAATAALRPDRRALKVDVLGRRLAPAELLRGFHRAHPDTDLDVVTLPDADAAVAAVRSGAVDASFRALGAPGRGLPDDVAAVRVLDEPLQLLTGPTHRLAGACAVTPAELAGHRIWMPAGAGSTEWAAYYARLAAEFGLTLDTTGPDFGFEALADVLAGSGEVATFIGGRSRLLWPGGHDLRCIPVRDPVPVYPHCLLWRVDDPHPVLARLRAHLARTRSEPGPGTWTPAWAR